MQPEDRIREMELTIEELESRLDTQDQRLDTQDQRLELWSTSSSTCEVLDNPPGGNRQDSAQAR